MVLPYADDDAVACTCIDYDAGDIDRHCPAHPHYDILEIEYEMRIRRIDEENDDV
jgi:hypothetical protein